jgi:hypothetical protein
VINHLHRIGSYKENQVIEINHDMANSMKLISRKVFPKAKEVTDEAAMKNAQRHRQLSVTVGAKQHPDN